MVSSLLQRSPVSAYLVRPNLSPSQPRWATSRTILERLNRQRSIIIWRTAMSLLIWTIGAASLNYLRHQPLLPTPAASTLALAASPGPTAPTTLTKTHVKPAAIARLVSVQPSQTAPAPDTSQPAATSLSDDSTGQILPPIPMAPYGTYVNRYARGQCTYYVATRRQLPSGWGNANHWFSAARSAGWGTGTTPAVGAIATTSAGAYGHVALVEAISIDYEQVYVAEMNYSGLYVRSHRWASAGSFKYIYQP